MVCNGSHPQGATGTARLHSHPAGTLQVVPLKMSSYSLASKVRRILLLRKQVAEFERVQVSKPVSSKLVFSLAGKI